MSYSEREIQLGLWHWLYRRGQRWIVPNACSIFSTGECDVLSIMKSGLSCEYEIKISRNDFRADAKKGKYELFELRMAGSTRQTVQGRWQPFQRAIDTPNFFSYVVPEGMVSETEVPHFAGLIYADENCRSFKVVRKPVRIHMDKLPDIERRIGQKLMYRYWHERDRTATAVGEMVQAAFEQHGGSGDAEAVVLR